MSFTSRILNLIDDITAYGVFNLESSDYMLIGFLSTVLIIGSIGIYGLLKK